MIWARHCDGEGGLEVKTSDLGTHHTGVTGALLPSPCLTQFLEGLGQGEQCSASTSGLGLLRFSGIACSQEGFLSCCLPVSDPGNRLSSHGVFQVETAAVGEVLQLANTRDVEDGFPQGAGATTGGRWLMKKDNRG